jgi:hypothetical protein
VFDPSTIPWYNAIIVKIYEFGKPFLLSN